jgi:transcriptional regulator with XRE-family HTH domain
MSPGEIELGSRSDILSGWFRQDYLAVSAMVAVEAAVGQWALILLSVLPLRGVEVPVTSLAVIPERVDDAGARRQELAQFLRARRASIQPEDVGLVRSSRRRVRGLRRHEVADLASVSVTWYTWLEQGRAERPSLQVLDSVSRALRFDEESRRHVRRLAGMPTGGVHRVSHVADPGLTAMLDDLLPSPAYLLTPANDLVAWNAAYARLFVDPSDLPPQHRNALWMMLFCKEMRNRITGWDIEVRETIARFYAESSRFTGDKRCAELIAELSETSELFKEAWKLQEVKRFVGHRQAVHHEDVGLIETQLFQLRPLDHPSLVLMVHRPADDESRSRLSELLAL